MLQLNLEAAHLCLPLIYWNLFVMQVEQFCETS